jgi:hypothetical protein
MWKSSTIASRSLADGGMQKSIIEDLDDGELDTIEAWVVKDHV